MRGPEIPGTDGTFPLDTIRPIARLPSPVSHCKDHDRRRKLLIHKTEGKLPESIFSEIREVNWPALRSFSDFSIALQKAFSKLMAAVAGRSARPTREREEGKIPTLNFAKSAKFRM